MVVTAGLLLLALSTSSGEESDVLRFPIARGPWVLESRASPNQHVEALGEQAGVWGSQAQGLEGWVYPYKLFDGWSMFVSPGSNDAHEQLGTEAFERGKRKACAGAASEAIRGYSEAPPPGSPASLQLLALRQIATPHLAQLEYAGSDWRLMATWFVPRSLPAVLLLLDYDGGHNLELLLRFRPSLAPMHLQPGGPLSVTWDEVRHELVVRESSRRLEMQVSCPFITGHRQIGTDGEQELQLRLPGHLGRQRHVPIGISFDFPAQPNGRVAMEQLKTNLANFFTEALAHYARLIARAPRIETPDPSANAALLWSVVSLDQLRIRNPDLGYGLVSGYSSSGRGTRPRYCWFFEEPTLTSRAYHWLGLSGQVREALQFLQHFQRGDGKTVHEVVQSLSSWTNYFREFPYAYLHSDGPVYYLFAYGDYYRATGDLDFLRREWPRIRRTLDWCLSAMDPEDGLMRIEPGDWGSSESSRAVWKDTQLQGMWVHVLRSMERLARLMGEMPLAEQCGHIAGKADASLNAQMWDEQSGTYFWGLDRQGRPLKSLVPHHAVSFWLASLPSERIERSLERMAAADFRTDWGVRSLAMSDPQYAPENYQAGSVWPVWNAGVIVSDFQHQRSVEGFRTWEAMVRARTLEGLGPMPEVLDGRRFQRLSEGVPHQMFSELAVVNGFLEGLLGLQVDVPGREVQLAPRLPPTWNKLDVERLPCGASRLDLHIRRSRGEYRLGFKLDWAGGTEVLLAPELPAGAQLLSALLDGNPVAHEVEQLPAAVRVRLKLARCSGQHMLRLRYAGGVDWFPVDEPLGLGMTSRNLRVVRARWQDSFWRLSLEGLPGRDYPVDFFTARAVVSASAGQRIEKCKTGWRVTFKAPPNAPTNTAGFASWNAEVKFH